MGTKCKFCGVEFPHPEDGCKKLGNADLCRNFTLFGQAQKASQEDAFIGEQVVAEHQKALAQGDPGDEQPVDHMAAIAGYLPQNIKAEVIAEASKIIDGARRADYGPPEDNFLRIARLWTAHFENTGRAITFRPDDVALMMILMKMARLAETPLHRDSIVDTIGYAACYAEIVLSCKPEMARAD